jgi:uncharacterized protein (DUF2384 family)
MANVRLPKELTLYAQQISASEEMTTELFEAAAEVVGSDGAAEWLLSPCYSLGNAIPMEYAAESKNQLEKVLDLLDGIAYGNFA